MFKLTLIVIYNLCLFQILKLVNDIKKHQDIKPSSDEALLTRNHFKLCSRIVKDFNDSKAQQPAGILDTIDGEYKDYFVWAGGLTKNVPDACEPGIVMIFTHFCSNFINI